MTYSIRSMTNLIMIAMMTLFVAMPQAFAQLKKDGTPDMRFKANKERYGQSSGSSSSSTYSSPQRSTYEAPQRQPTRPSYEAPQRPSYSPPPPRRETYTPPQSYNDVTHRKADGTPDMRFKENKERFGSGSSSGSSSTYTPPQRSTYTPTRPAPGPLKQDGTPDMRYKANKDAYGSSSSQQPTAPAQSRVKTNTDRSQWNRQANGRYTEPGTGRALNNDGTYDMRSSSNGDLKNTTAQPRTGRPQTTTPRNSWTRNSNGRYVEPGTGRALNNDGTYDMRARENKSLPNPSARVRIGSDNSNQANRRSTETRNRYNTVIVNNYNTYIHNTYVTNVYDYGSWGWQNRYYGAIVWGQPTAYCSFYCTYYTPTYWNPWIERYSYYPAVYYVYRPVVLSETDLSVGLISWLFINAARNAEMDRYYRDSLQVQDDISTFRYAQAYLPTEDFVELARDLSGADPQVVETFMTGLQNMTTLLEDRIRTNQNLPDFTIQHHDIDVRLAENHGNRLVVLKGQIDRRDEAGRSYARADFTATIDLRLGLVKLFVPTINFNGSAEPTAAEIQQLQAINEQIERIDTQIGYEGADDIGTNNGRTEPLPAATRDW